MMVLMYADGNCPQSSDTTQAEPCSDTDTDEVTSVVVCTQITFYLKCTDICLIFSSSPVNSKRLTTPEWCKMVRYRTMKYSYDKFQLCYKFLSWCCEIKMDLNLFLRQSRHAGMTKVAQQIAMNSIMVRTTISRVTVPVGLIKRAVVGCGTSTMLGHSGTATPAQHHLGKFYTAPRISVVRSYSLLTIFLQNASWWLMDRI